MSGVSLRLDGKVALITGGARGIGAETVRLFCEAGAKVVFNYRQAWERAEALAAECGGDRCVAIKQELSTAEDGRVLVEKAVAAFGRLDILVANHGIWPAENAAISEMTDEQWRRTMAVNLDSVFGVVGASVAQMLRQAGGLEAARTAGRETGGTSEGGGASSNTDTTGHIVVISSTAAQRGEAFHADYAASKGALISLTKSLSGELARKGILVNCVAPGWVATEMSEPAVSDPELGPKILRAIPVGRVATAREVAGPVLFLCTPLAGFISGEVLNVNGGSVLAG